MRLDAVDLGARPGGQIGSVKQKTLELDSPELRAGFRSCLLLN